MFLANIGFEFYLMEWTLAKIHFGCLLQQVLYHHCIDFGGGVSHHYKIKDMWLG